MNVIDEISNAYKRTLPPFRVGDTVSVHYRIQEGDKSRIQVFKGVVLRRRGGDGVDGTFTVRKVSYGVGVERIFPINSPLVEKVEVSSRNHVRRARLYYLRDRKGKAARLRELRFTAIGGGDAEVGASEIASQPAAEEPPAEE